MISIKKLTYFIGIMFLVSSLLLVVSNNIPLLTSFRWVWGPITLVYAFVLNPNTYKNKMVFNALLFGVLFCWLLPFLLWNNTNDWYLKDNWEWFYAMITSVVLFGVLLKQKYFYTWAKLSKIALVFIVITGFMTIVTTRINPSVVRLSYSQPELITSLFKYGFGSYGYMTALIALLPTLVYLYRMAESKKHKYLYLLLMAFFLFVLLRAQIFTNLMVGVVTLAIAFLGTKHIKTTIIVLFLFFIMAFVIPKQYYADALVSASSYVDKESDTYYKLNDMAIFVLNPELDTSTSAGSRTARYPDLIEVLKAKPLLGDASYNSGFDEVIGTGAHLYWMSRLALWGLLGFIGYIIILGNIIKPVFKLFDKYFSYYYLISVLSIITMGLMKSLGGREIWIMLLIIIPGLYFDTKQKSIKRKLQYNG